MIVRHSAAPLHYLRSPWETAVEAACAAWEGTPYKLNKCTRGRYVDCIHFAAAVLDTLFGTSHSRGLQSLPPDACIHNRRGVEVALRALLRAYPQHRVRDGSVEAGDLVIWGRASLRSGPSHLLVASLPNKLWHATPPSVAFSGYSIPDTHRLLAVYRSKNKHLW